MIESLTTCLAGHKMTSVGQWVKREEGMGMTGRDTGQNGHTEPGAAFLGNIFRLCFMVVTCVDISLIQTQHAT